VNPPYPALAEQLRDILSGRTDIRVALLFGSEARGTAGPTSDIDLAVVAPEVDLLDLGATLSSLLSRDVDIISLEDPPIPLLERILKDGIVVHEGYRGAGASWRSKTLCTLEIDRPWFARMRDAWLDRLSAKGSGESSFP
jgi:predicted nucleotidyltransferase